MRDKYRLATQTGSPFVARILAGVAGFFIEIPASCVVPDFSRSFFSVYSRTMPRPTGWSAATGSNTTS
jgi:hypothetical protein